MFRELTTILSITTTVIGFIAFATQKPIKEEPVWIDGTSPPPSLSKMKAEAETVVVADYTPESVCAH